MGARWRRLRESSASRFPVRERKDEPRESVGPSRGRQGGHGQCAPPKRTSPRRPYRRRFRRAVDSCGATGDNPGHVTGRRGRRWSPRSESRRRFVPSARRPERCERRAPRSKALDDGPRKVLVGKKGGHDLSHQAVLGDPAVDLLRVTAVFFPGRVQLGRVQRRIEGVADLVVGQADQPCVDHRPGRHGAPVRGRPRRCSARRPARSPAGCGDNGPRRRPGRRASSPDSPLGGRRRCASAMEVNQQPDHDPCTANTGLASAHAGGRGNSARDGDGCHGVFPSFESAPTALYRLSMRIDHKRAAAVKERSLTAAARCGGAGDVLTPPPGRPPAAAPRPCRSSPR